jgi:ABC-type dipeptide/oligopeptide/nickel transport system permease component
VTRYIVGRLIQAVILIIAVTALTFILVRLAPGDPISFLVGERANPEFQERLRRELGLDQPLHVQLVTYFQHLARGDLGFSFTYQAPVLTVILSRLQPTLLLMAVSLVLSALVGIWSGVSSAVNAGSRRAAVVTVGSLVGYSIPAFWLGQILILVFGVWLGWLPILGMTSRFNARGPEQWLDIALHLVLPVLTLTVFHVALISRLTRAAMLEVLDLEFVRVARSKGLSERVVVYRHALANAALPIITVLGLQLGSLVAGFVLVETVFGWPGLGRLTFDSIAARDYPVITGLFIFVAASVILSNLAADIAYAVADPRVRYR